MIDLFFWFQMLRCQELLNEESNVRIIIHQIQIPIQLIQTLIQWIQDLMWSAQIQDLILPNDFKKSDQIKLIQLIQIQLIQLILIKLVRQNAFNKSGRFSKTRSLKGD